MDFITIKYFVLFNKIDFKIKIIYYLQYFKILKNLN